MTVVDRDYDVPQVALMERAALVVEPEEPLTVDRVLRRLEVVRQRLAVRWCGTKGAFSGYETLDLRCEEALTSGVVTFSALLVSAHERSHTVELVAAVIRPHDEQADSESTRVLARGKGRTLEINCP